MDGIVKGEVKKGQVLIIRYEGPKVREGEGEGDSQ